MKNTFRKPPATNPAGGLVRYGGLQNGSIHRIFLYYLKIFIYWKSGLPYTRPGSDFG
jgi:hypothetical protein